MRSIFLLSFPPSLCNVILLSSAINLILDNSEIVLIFFNYYMRYFKYPKNMKKILLVNIVEYSIV